MRVGYIHIFFKNFRTAARVVHRIRGRYYDHFEFFQNAFESLRVVADVIIRSQK